MKHMGTTNLIEYQIKILFCHSYDKFKCVLFNNFSTLTHDIRIIRTITNRKLNFFLNYLDFYRNCILLMNLVNLYIIMAIDFIIFRYQK